MKKTIIGVAILAMAAVFLTGCASTDVILKYSPGSFKKMVEAYPDLVTDTTKTDQYYYISVDGETKLIVSNDYALSGTDDIMIETPLQPFIDAGLDVALLSNGFKVSGDTLYLTADYGKGTGIKTTVQDALFDSVTAERTNLTYHASLDHYGIKLTNGKFEWAKEYTTNDKDIVFVIYAQPMKDLGVDVANISGWIFMTLEDPDGSKTDVLVKPYNLDNK